MLVVLFEYLLAKADEVWLDYAYVGKGSTDVYLAGAAIHRNSS